MSEQEAIIGNDWLRKLEDKAEESNRLRKENERLLEALKGVIVAWEALPGGREYAAKEIAAWLRGPMASSINKARKTLNEEHQTGRKTCE